MPLAMLPSANKPFEVSVLTDAYEYVVSALRATRLQGRLCYTYEVIVCASTQI